MESNTKNIVFSGALLPVNDNAINIDGFKKQIPENTYSNNSEPSKRASVAQLYIFMKKTSALAHYDK